LKEELLIPASGPDIALVRRAQAGDGEAFTQLFHQLHQPVLNYIYRTVGDRQAAEDITQDAFIRAHERVGQLGPPWDFKSWVFRIASNLAIDYLRQGKRFVDVEEPLDMGGPPTTRRPAERQVQRGEARQSVEATLVLMPTKYRQALVLREINGLTYSEVASALECSNDNARQLVHRARLNFRELHGIRLMATSGAAQCRELGELISAFRDGELSTENQRAVKRHIAACKHCQETEEDLKKVAAMVAGLVPILPRPGWTEEVLERLKSSDRPAAKTGGSGSEGAGGGINGGLGGGGPGSAFKSLFSGGMWGKVVLAASIGVAAGLVTIGIVLGMMDVTFKSSVPVPLPILHQNEEKTKSSPELSSTDEGTARSTLDESSASDDTPTPTPTLTIMPTSTPCTASVTANVNATCRFGPGQIWNAMGYLLQGETSPIDGRNATSTWWWILNPDAQGHCWIWDGTVTIVCYQEDIPIIEPPPTPEPPDEQPPSISISHSPTGTWHPDENEVVTFTAMASDDGGVAKIEIWVQSPGAGQMSIVKTCQKSVSCTFLGGPYSPGALTYSAKAWDLADNLGESLPVLITVHSVVK
jgi:RNA polymerase sigma-70 factor (ECF subfamily)